MLAGAGAGLTARHLEAVAARLRMNSSSANLRSAMRAGARPTPKIPATSFSRSTSPTSKAPRTICSCNTS